MDIIATQPYIESISINVRVKFESTQNTIPKKSRIYNDHEVTTQAYYENLALKTQEMLLTQQFRQLF